MSQDTQNKNDPLHLEVDKPIWKLSKRIKAKLQNKDNTSILNVDRLVLIDNFPILQTVDDRLDDNLYHLKDQTSLFSRDKLYPVYRVKRDPEIGDIIIYKDLQDISQYGIVIKILVGDDIVIKTATETTVVIKPNITNIFSLFPENISIIQYSDNTFRCGDIFYSSKEELLLTYSDKDIKFINKEYTYEIYQISKYYNIKPEEIIPKDVIIMQELITTLDHPLNIQAKEWALLVGESGSGKSQIAVKYAEDHNKEYIKIQCTAQTTVDDLIGYKSIVDGVYFPSLLRDAVETGKVCILDELDAANNNTLLVLNGLKQDYFQFPDKLVKVHENFRLIATANTLLYDERYNARQPLDHATKSRFHIIEYNMKPSHLAIRYGFNNLKQIQYDDEDTAREVERKIRQFQIKENL